MNVKELEKWIQEVDKKLDNHLHIVTADISQIKTDLEWVKKTYWTLAGATITAIIGAFIALVFK